MQKIEDYSLNAPAAHITNFSDGVPTVIELTEILNKLPDSWKCQMIETHHVNKKDAPCGTANSWVSKLNRECKTESIREGEVFGEHKLVLSCFKMKKLLSNILQKTEICLLMVAQSKYIDWISEQKPGFYDKMDLATYNKPRIRKYFSDLEEISSLLLNLLKKKWKQFVKTESEKDELSGWNYFLVKD